MNREKVQGEALNALNSTYGGTLVMSPGTGKSKVAIDFIKKEKPEKVLITSPRTNLKENWRKELEKWDISTQMSGAEGANENNFYYLDYSKPVGENWISLTIDLVNIQTCYKWDEDKLNQYDLIIADEIHTMVTPEYGKLFKIADDLVIPIVGLTGTPDDNKLDKSIFYANNCPIVYRYLDSAKDGIINKRKYIVYEHTLDNIHEVLAGTKTNKWLTGEKKQYDYIQSMVSKAEKRIRDILGIENEEEYVNYFGKSKAWRDGDDVTKKSAGWAWNRAISARQEMLWNLTSTGTLAELMADYILESYTDSKVLVFSERTAQANKISNYTVHSKNKKEVNDDLLAKFMSGEIRQLGSCYALTLGLNIDNAGFAIMESYNGSDVQFAQRSGRVDRLPVDENAIVILIVVKDTQSETWFNNAVKFKDGDIVKTVNNILDFQETLNELKS